MLWRLGMQNNSTNRRKCHECIVADAALRIMTGLGTRRLDTSTNARIVEMILSHSEPRQRLKFFVAVKGDGCTAGVEPRQKTGLNSILAGGRTFPWDFNGVFVPPDIRRADNQPPLPT